MAHRLNKNMNETVKSIPLLIAGVMAVTVVEIYALSKGINGVYLTMAIGAICAIVGVKAGTILEHRYIAKNNKEIESN